MTSRISGGSFWSQRESNATGPEASLESRPIERWRAPLLELPLSPQSAALTASPIQRKPTVSAPGDVYEREADMVADEVMRMAEPASSDTAGAIHRRESTPRGAEQIPSVQLERAPSASSGGDRNVDLAVRAADRAGEPLPRAAREFFEPRFGFDFSRVRIHASGEATSAASAVGARAYTLGSQVVFGQGQYAPSTSAGRHLLAHELAHVVQQTRAPGAGKEANGNGAALKAVTSPTLQRAIKFDEDLIMGLADPKTGLPEMFYQFLDGLQTYLGLSYDMDSSSGNAVITNPKKSDEDEKRIRALFMKNYAAYYNRKRFIEANAPDAAREGLKEWGKIRDLVFNALKDNAAGVGFVKMNGNSEARGAEAHVETRTVMVNVRDYLDVRMPDPKVAPDVARSFDGFWRMVHEILHISLGIKSDYDSGGRQGAIEVHLNPLRIGFGLPERTLYSTKTADGKLATVFDDKYMVTYPDK